MRGMMFKPWKIKAIADSRPDFEWQTRRPGGLKEINKEPEGWRCGELYQGEWGFDKGKQFVVVKPRFQIGDVVYIKEAWWRDQSGGVWGYKLDGMEWPPPNCGGKSMSPLFMPEWAARYFIRILDIGLERLQDISWADCLREGIQQLDEQDIFFCAETPKLSYSVPQGAYAQLWDSINKNQKWATNPFVWKYSFKEVK